MDPCENIVAFHTDYFDETKMYLLREILRKRAIERVWEIRWSMTSEIELDSFSPSYAQSGGSTKLYGANGHVLRETEIVGVMRRDTAIRDKAGALSYVL